MGAAGVGCSSRDSALLEAAPFRDPALLESIERTLVWLESDAGESRYAELNRSGDRAPCIAGAKEMRAAVHQARDARMFVNMTKHLFDPDPVDVLFTGYFAPEYEASRAPTDEFTIPLYTLPDELRASRDAAWRTRSEIEDESLLAGRELVWLANPLDVYLIHVNGSARLRMTDGTIMHIGHSGTNNLEYSSIGRLMIDDGRATADEMSVPTIRRIYEDDPVYVLSLMSRNDRYVFFEEVVGGWPRGGMGMVLTPLRSAAVDPEFYPPGSILLVVTELATPDGGFEPFVQLMVAQDVGGAIKGPGRIDLFIGVGDEAGEIAGRQVSQGVVYPLLLRR